MRVLVVEDEHALAETITRELRRHGYDAFAAPTGREALKLHHVSDFVLLDLGLPDMDGLGVCRVMRAASTVPIIAVAGRRGELERVLSLQAGADDCVEKPCGVRELTARIEAIMRRVRTAPVHTGTFENGPLRIDSSDSEKHSTSEVTAFLPSRLTARFRSETGRPAPY